MNRLLLVAVALAAFPLRAGLWRGLVDANHYSGPKLSEEDLEGKVVMIDEWGVKCPPCRALLPLMQKYYSAFKTKPFVLIGSHRQGRRTEAVAQLVETHSLTYPIYDNVGLAVGEPDNGRAIPFIYVVNHRGKVVYSGRSAQAAIEAAQDAMLMVGQPPSLTAGVFFDKKHPYKALAKQLQLGKNVAAAVKKLKEDVKKAEGKSATARDRETGEVAQELLKAIEEGKREVQEEIAYLKEKNPPEALKLVEAFVKSFPAEGKEYKAEMPALKAAAAEYEAARKAKGAEPKKAAR